MCPHDYELGDCDLCTWQAIADEIVRQGPQGPLAGIVPDGVRGVIGWD